jgi:hypothetical protein
MEFSGEVSFRPIGSLGSPGESPAHDPSLLSPVCVSVGRLSCRSVGLLVCQTGEKTPPDFPACVSPREFRPLSYTTQSFRLSCCSIDLDLRT